MDRPGGTCRRLEDGGMVGSFPVTLPCPLEGPDLRGRPFRWRGNSQAPLQPKRLVRRLLDSFQAWHAKRLISHRRHRKLKPGWCLLRAVSRLGRRDARRPRPLRRRPRPRRRRTAPRGWRRCSTGGSAGPVRSRRWPEAATSRRPPRRRARGRAWSCRAPGSIWRNATARRSRRPAPR